MAKNFIKTLATKADWLGRNGFAGNKKSFKTFFLVLGWRFEREIGRFRGEQAKMRRLAMQVIEAVSP